ncbi:MAG: PHP-associated domain-containing protein [Chloroflexota bacterium]
MGKADLHAHSRHDGWTDGNQTVAELLDYVEQKTDLDVFAITDHDSTDAARAAQDLHRQGVYRFEFLPGVEVTHQQGHMLCYFPSGDIHDIPSLRPLWSTVRYAHERGGICVVAHPVYPPWLCGSILRGLARGEILDGVEAMNAGIGARAQEKLEAIVAPLGEKIGLVANSDAHQACAIGSAYTSFSGHTTADFIKALHTRTTQPVLERQPVLDPKAKRYTTRRSLTHPGWLRNLYREFAVR